MRVSRWLLWMAAGLSGFAALSAPLLYYAANTAAGRVWMAQTVAMLTAGEVALSGLSGHFPDSLRASHLELRDGQGVWLSADGVALDWSPLRLLQGVADIGLLAADHIAWQRFADTPETEESAESSLPVKVSLRRLQVGRLELAEPVAGIAAAVRMEGESRLDSLQQGEAKLSLKRLDGDGSYQFQGSFHDGQLQLRLNLQESSSGLIAALADFQALESLSLQAVAEGQWSALQTHADLSLGPLRASLDGKLDMAHDRAESVAVNASAPAMRLRPDLAWQGVDLTAKVQGSFDRPTADARLRIDQLNAAGVSVRKLALTVLGDAGQLRLDGGLTGLSLPAPGGQLLEAAPLAVQASIRLDAPQYPVAFTLSHPLLAATGKADTVGEVRGEVALNLPDLRPLVALGGVDVRGKAALTLRAAQQGERLRLDADGTLGLTDGLGPLPKLLGNAARLGVSVERQGEEVTLSRLTVDGQGLSLAADGKLANQTIAAQWKLLVRDLSPLLTQGAGLLTALGQVSGPVGQFSVAADVSGEIAAQALPRGPVNASIRLDGLPHAPIGQVKLGGKLGGAPLEFDGQAKAAPDGGIEATLNRAEWKSVHASAGLTLAKGADWPVGNIGLRVGRLDDLAALLNPTMTGSAEAVLELSQASGRPQARLQLDARQAGMHDSFSVREAKVSALVIEPAKRPVVTGEAHLQGLAVGKTNADLRLDVDGPLDALLLRLSAAVAGLGDAETQLDAAARVDALAKQASITDVKAQAQGETLRLSYPVRLSFADGLAFDRLSLAWREAELELSGRLMPALGLTASLRRLSIEPLAARFQPAAPVAGLLEAEARLTGSLARPVGTVEAQAVNLQLLSQAGRGLPPAKLTLKADLMGAAARLDARLSAGSQASLGLDGDVPLNPSGLLGLHAVGNVDLKLLDPLLTAAGRRLRGQASLNADLAGTWAKPQLRGSLQLVNGEVQDFTLGAHLSQINALLQAEGESVRINRFDGRAGQGTFAVGGSLDWLAEGMPVNLSLTVRKARPLADDRLTVNLSGDLALRGQMKGALTADGKVFIHRADIRIPERLPAKIAVLNVQRPGDAPPAPPPPASQSIALNLTLESPGEIFVRGRGLDAELGGRVHLRGTTDKPQPGGGFTLRRGQFTLAGQALTFSKGEVGFDGGKLADPSLNFIANTSNGHVTATLTVTGSVSQPQIKLSSVPELPQDEILAQLLFGRAAASLSPLEMVQIASAVASLTGVTGGLGNPLESVRTKLGLDRLSVGGSSPALEAGRYVAPGVYVGAKQGVTGAGTQATVQIDITKGLKVEGTAGTGTTASGTTGSTNSVGVIYQHEY